MIVSAQLGTGQNAHAAAGVDIFLFAACFASMIVKKIWVSFDILISTCSKYSYGRLKCVSVATNTSQ